MLFETPFSVSAGIFMHYEILFREHQNVFKEMKQRWSIDHQHEEYTKHIKITQSNTYK